MHKLLSIIYIFLSLSASAQYKSQLELVKKYPSGNYSVYRNVGGKLDKVGKQWPIQINMGSGGLIESVLIKRSGVVDEEFKPDLKEQPGYFSYDKAKLIFLENYAVYYTQSMHSDGQVTYEILYEFVTESGSSRVFKDAIADIAAYRAATLASQSGARVVIAKNNAATEEKERTENSTKGKTVKSIKYVAVDIPNQLGLLSKVKFGMIATLADGKELKTRNLGGKSDFDNSYVVTAPGCTFADGVLEIGLDAAPFTNDEIVITIKNLHNTSQSITEKITLLYNNPITLKGLGESGRNGFSGSSGSSGCPGKSGKNGEAGGVGQNGSDFSLKIKETKHKITGELLYSVEIIQSRERKTIKYKCTASTPLILLANGGNGGDGGSGGSGGNSLSSCPGGRASGGNGAAGGAGGSGGQISITKASAGISTSFIEVINTGGRLGRGGKGGSGGIGGSSGSEGYAGKDGSTSTSTGAVNISW